MEFSTEGVVDVVMYIRSAQEPVHIYRRLDTFAKYSLDCRPILIDDCQDQTLRKKLLADAARRKWLLVENFNHLGYAQSLNKALRLSCSPFVLLIDGEVSITEPGVIGMLDCAISEENVGLVIPRFDTEIPSISRLSPGGVSLEALAVFVAGLPVEGHSGEYQVAPLLEPSCLLLKRAVVNTVGMFRSGSAADDGMQARVAVLEEFRQRAENDGFVARIATNSYISRQS